MNNPEHKFQKLINWFHKDNTYIIAFSGSVDSCLMLYAAREAVGYNKTIASGFSLD